MARSKVTTRSTGTQGSSGFSPGFYPTGNPLRAKRLGVGGPLSGAAVPFTAKRIEYLHGNLMQVAEELEDIWDEIQEGSDS